MAFGENDPQQILTMDQIIKGINVKNLEAALLHLDFSKTFYSIHVGKAEQKLFTYGLPEEIVTAIMMLYKNMKATVC